MSPTMDQPRRAQTERERTKTTGRRRAQPSGSPIGATGRHCRVAEDKHDAGTRHCGDPHRRGTHHARGHSRGRTGAGGSSRDRTGGTGNGGDPRSAGSSELRSPQLRSQPRRDRPPLPFQWCRPPRRRPPPSRLPPPFQWWLPVRSPPAKRQPPLRPASPRGKSAAQVAAAATASASLASRKDVRTQAASPKVRLWRIVVRPRTAHSSAQGRDGQAHEPAHGRGGRRPGPGSDGRFVGPSP
jgi:hypothetical protein